MIVALYPIAVMVIGLLLWALASNPKASEAGKILFACGALILTMTLARESFRIG